MDDPHVDALTAGRAGPAAVRGGALRLLSFVASGTFGTVGSAILLRHLGVQDSGRYLSIVALVTVVGGISDLGVTQLGMRELALAAQSDRSVLARELLALRYVLTFAGLVVMLAFAAAAYRLPIIAGVAIAGVGLLVQVTADNYGLLLQVELRLGWVAAAEVSRALGACILTAVLALLGGRVVVFAAVPVAGSAASLAVVAVAVGRRHSPFPRFQARQMRLLLAQVAPYALAMVTSTLYPRAGIVALHLLSNGHQLGLYGASTRVIDGLAAIPVLLIGTVLPIMFRAAAEDAERLRYAISRVFSVVAVFGMGAAVALAAGARITIALLGGTQFDFAARVLVVQAVGFGFSFVAILWANVLLSQRRHRELVLLSCLALLVLVIGLAVLVPGHGARGAAIAMAAAEGVSVVVGSGIVYRDRELGLPDLAVVAKVVLCGACALGASMLVHPDVARLVVAVLAYGVMVPLTRALPAEAWSGLASWWNVRR